jgi:hypothetical protein
MIMDDSCAIRIRTALSGEILLLILTASADIGAPTALSGLAAAGGAVGPVTRSRGWTCHLD